MCLECRYCLFSLLALLVLLSRFALLDILDFQFEEVTVVLCVGCQKICGRVRPLSDGKSLYHQSCCLSVGRNQLKVRRKKRNVFLQDCPLSIVVDSWTVSQSIYL